MPTGNLDPNLYGTPFLPLLRRSTTYVPWTKQFCAAWLQTLNMQSQWVYSFVCCLFCSTLSFIQVVNSSSSDSFHCCIVLLYDCGKSFLCIFSLRHTLVASRLGQLWSTLPHSHAVSHWPCTCFSGDRTQGRSRAGTPLAHAHTFPGSGSLALGRHCYLLLHGLSFHTTT